MSVMNTLTNSLDQIKEPFPGKFGSPVPEQPISVDVQGTAQVKSESDNPNLNPDFKTIKFISFIVIFFLKKCWMMCSTGLFLTFIAYWCYGSMFAFCLFLVGLTGLFYQISDWLLYHPDEPAHSRIYVPMPSLIGLPSESIFIQTEDKVEIHGVFIKQDQAIVGQVPTILFLHGNAGNIGHRLPFIQGLYNMCRCNILLLEYRGYGLSKSCPSEEGLYFDAQAGLKFLLQIPCIDKKKIVVFGRSLGGAVAIDLLSKPQFAKHILTLIVENTFTSIPEIAQEILNFPMIRWVPRWMYKNKFDSVAKISSVKRPALFLSGQADALIPPEMMRKLSNLCGSTVKRLQLFTHGTHNDTWRCKGYYRSINMFLDDVMLIQAQPQQWPVQNYNSNGPGEIY